MTPERACNYVEDAMAHHTLKPGSRTLHGHFSPELPPSLSVDPGDTVRLTTLDAGWGLEPFGAEGKRAYFEPRSNIPGDDGHALLGPIEVRGAEPGMALSVQIGSIIPGAFGFNMAGGKFPEALNRALGALGGETVRLDWTLDAEAMVGRSSSGHSVALRPFLGVMGMPPAEPGIHPTAPPRVWGGNLDCKELTSGTTLYLPIPVSGAHFSAGDGHAAQGDGEVSGTAIECPMTRADLTFDIREDMNLTVPRAKTETAWLSFGFHEDVNIALQQALADMLTLMTELLGVSRKEALALASVVVDMRVTQVVNGVCGVHAALPHGALRFMGAARPR